MKLATLVLCAMLTGCNGMPQPFYSDPIYDQAFVVHSGGPVAFLFMGSAIQWNEDYAVTVKHIPYLPGAVHQGVGDVQFFRHKGPAPTWRSYQPGEAVTAVGFSSLYTPVKGEGHALSGMLRLARNDVLYATHDGPTAKGMSGGPVFTQDGYVVGITVAFADQDELRTLGMNNLADQKRVSLFLPYAEIRKEWARYQKEQHHD
jgi:hypothetical protein